MSLGTTSCTRSHRDTQKPGQSNAQRTNHWVCHASSSVTSRPSPTTCCPRSLAPHQPPRVVPRWCPRFLAQLPRREGGVHTEDCHGAVTLSAHVISESSSHPKVPPTFQPRQTWAPGPPTLCCHQRPLDLPTGLDHTSGKHHTHRVYGPLGHGGYSLLGFCPQASAGASRGRALAWTPGVACLQRGMEGPRESAHADLPSSCGLGPTGLNLFSHYTPSTAWPSALCWRSVEARLRKRPSANSGVCDSP